AVVAADNPGARAFENADDAAFDLAAFLDALDAHDDAVAVHGVVQMRAGDVDVAARVELAFRKDEAIPRRVRLQPAHVEIHLLRQAESMAADLNQVAGSDQGLHVAL